MGRLNTNQAKRVLEQCLRVNKSYHEGSPDDDKDVMDFQVNDYYINIGWIQALRLILGEDTIPISSSPLKDYKKGFNILMEFWENIPEHVRPEVHKELKEIGL